MSTWKVNFAPHISFDLGSRPVVTFPEILSTSYTPLGDFQRANQAADLEKLLKRDGPKNVLKTIHRNERIRKEHQSGVDIQQLVQKYGLQRKSINKILAK